MSESNQLRMAGAEYQIEADRKTHCVVFEGIMRLESTTAYKPMDDMLWSLAALNPALLTLDLRKLESMNSSGINSLSKFLMEVGKQKGTSIKVKANKDITWQDRMLRNIQRVIPGFDLDFS